MKTTLLFFLTIFSLQNMLAQTYDFTVAADGSGNFTSVQAAIDACKAFPDAPITIFVKNGVYREKVKVPACNTHLRIIGESVEKTIISYDDFFDRINRGRNSTFYTYTLMVEADDFRAENLTIENTAGSVGQAVALHVEGDRCAFVNCRLLGFQDTLYLAGHTSRHYFGNCYIEGTTDYIFGAATAFFEGCTLHSKSNSYITAASTPLGKKYGFVFSNCTLTAAAGVDKVYLGRPWRDFAKVVFIDCDLGDHIAAEGWANWNNTSRDKTAYFAEFGNKSSGANTNKRVKWSHQLTKKQAKAYTKAKVLSPAIPSPEPRWEDWANVK